MINLDKSFHPNFFSLFTSKYANLYVEALFVLLQCFRRDFSIRKEELISSLCAALEDQFSHFQDEDYEGDDSEITLISEKAHLMVRKLLYYGWLEKEPPSRVFEDLYTIPEYSLRFIKLLHDLIFTKPREYNTLVYSTYTNLKIADQDQDDFMYEALVQAHNMTLEFKDSLRNLSNNMRKYYLSLSELKNVKDILSDHFENYQVLVNEKIYHPMKTIDSVPRFKYQILNLLRSWLNNDEVIDKLQQSMSVRGYAAQIEHSKEAILIMINDIIEIYENIQYELDDIDKKNNTYISASVERMRYLMSTEHNVKGLLIDALKALPSYKEPLEEHKWSALSESLGLFFQDHIHNKSLYKEREREEKHIPDPLMLSDAPDPAQIKNELSELKEQLEKGISREKIINFIRQKLGRHLHISTDEINLASDSEFVNLILTCIMSDEPEFPYEITFEQGSIFVNGYRIPLMNIDFRGEDADDLV